MVVLAAVSYAVRLPPVVLAPPAVAIGALLAAGSLTDGDRAGWPGLLFGAACAMLAWFVASRFFARAGARLDAAGGLLDAYGDLIALALAIVAIVLPPFGLAAIAVLVVLLIRGRRADERKYEGLRILR